MHGAGLVALLGHPAQHRPCAPGAPAERGECRQRGAHRLGVGVVGVVDDRDAVRPSVTSIRHFEAGTAALRAAATPSGVPPSSSATAAAASALPTWCSPTSRSATGARPAGATSVKRARPPSRRTSSARTWASCPPEGHDARGGARRHRGDERVVGVQHRDPVRGQRLDQLALGLRDRADRAELAQVRAPDVEHHPDPRRRDRGEPRDVPGAAGGELQHEVAGAGVGAQRRPGQAELVVERPGRRDGGPERGEHRGEQVLGGGLAGAAGDPDDRGRRQRPHCVPGERGERGEDGGACPVVVALVQVGAGLAGHRRRDHGGRVDLAPGEHARGPGGHRRRRVGVPVDPLARQRDEQAAGRDRARVELDGGHPLLPGGAVQASTGDGGDVGQPHLDHALVLLIGGIRSSGCTGPATACPAVPR